jgi:predicted DNA-binding protein with PD1-like motif
MKFRMIDSGGSRTYIVVLETGEEVSASLHRFAEQNQLQGSSFKAIGAFSSVKLGWFNWQTKKYETAVHLQEQVEVLSLIGDVALKDGKPAVHAHVIVGKRDGTAHGGHLLEAHVRPTLELVLTEGSEPLRKFEDRESGIAVIEP